MVATLVEKVFPRFVRTTTDAQLASLEQTDIARIRGADWSRHPDVALEEARRLADAELARRQNADGKASTYLAAAAALIPLALTLRGLVWDRKIGSAPPWINVVGLAVAVVYVLNAGLWSFRTLTVSASHRVDVGDLVAIWTDPDPRPKTVAETLVATRMNWNGVNKKVSCIKMAHAFLLRAFLAFSVLLLFNAAWTLGSPLIGSLRDRAITPKVAIRGDAGPPVVPATSDAARPPQRLVSAPQAEASGMGRDGRAAQPAPSAIIPPATSGRRRRPASCSAGRSTDHASGGVRCRRSCRPPPVERRLEALPRLGSS